VPFAVDCASRIPALINGRLASHSTSGTALLGGRRIPNSTRSIVSFRQACDWDKYLTPVTLLGLTQKESAKWIGVDACTLARLEWGEREPAGTFAASVKRFLAAAEPHGSQSQPGLHSCHDPPSEGILTSRLVYLL
jgi:DNA-binding XRE family transcriptional regulator